jgi:hypothetical protein
MTAFTTSRLPPPDLLLTPPGYYLWFRTVVLSSRLTRHVSWLAAEVLSLQLSFRYFIHEKKKDSQGEERKRKRKRKKKKKVKAFAEISTECSQLI